MNEPSYKGNCFCGAVQLTVSRPEWVIVTARLVGLGPPVR